MEFGTFREIVLPRVDFPEFRAFWVFGLKFCLFGLGFDVFGVFGNFTVLVIYRCWGMSMVFGLL